MLVAMVMLHGVYKFVVDGQPLFTVGQGRENGQGPENGKSGIINFNLDGAVANRLNM